MKTISSSITFFYKYIFLPFFLITFGLLPLIIVIFAIFDENISWLGLSASIPFFLIAYFVYIRTGKIKNVKYDGYKLYISNYFRAWEIDVLDIETISDSKFIGPEIVKIKLSKSIDSSNIITFIPKFRFFSFENHPIIKEIRGLTKT